MNFSVLPDLSTFSLDLMESPLGSVNSQISENSSRKSFVLSTPRNSASSVRNSSISLRAITYDNTLPASTSTAFPVVTLWFRFYAK